MTEMTTNVKTTALATPEKKLNMDMWLKTTVLSNDNVGETARVAGLPTVLKVKCWNGQRFAWIAIGEMITLKVWEGSELGKRLNIGWRPVIKCGWRDEFKHPVITRSLPVVVEGVIHTLADGGLTMHHAKVVGGVVSGGRRMAWVSADVQAKGLAWVMGSAFEVQYTEVTGNATYLQGYLGTKDADLIPFAEKLQAQIKTNNPMVAALLEG